MQNSLCVTYRSYTSKKCEPYSKAQNSIADLFYLIYFILFYFIFAYICPPSSRTPCGWVHWNSVYGFTVEHEALLDA